MTQKEKNLLFQDLCARLPYDIIVEYGCKHDGKDLGERKGKLTGRMLDSYFKNIQIGMSEVYSIKPYLRPMSSMTEEERKELKDWCDITPYETQGLKIDEYGVGVFLNGVFSINYDVEDLLNAKHFDYRGLIEKGLAIEAPEGMYNN